MLYHFVNDLEFFTFTIKWIFIISQMKTVNEIPNLAGNVSIENFDVDILYKCEQALQQICSDIIKEWEIRFVANPFMDAIHTAFGRVEEHSEEELRNLLTSVIMTHPQKDEYNIETTLLGYKLYNNYALYCKSRNTNVSIEKKLSKIPN